MTKSPDWSSFPPSPLAGGGSWPPLAPGTEVAVTKLSPAGEAVAHYPATAVDIGAPVPWVTVEARWTYKTVETHGLAFHPGDALIEYFSPNHPYDVFAVFSPAGALRGWYANVTYPTLLDPAADPPRLTWHDLYLDVVLVPGNEPVLLDEDELDASNLPVLDPALTAQVRAVAAELLRLARLRRFPFHDADRDLQASPDAGEESASDVPS